MSNQQGMTRLTEVAPELQICCPDRRRPAAPRDWSKIDDRPSIPDHGRPGVEGSERRSHLQTIVS
jgi:hypothetical protein